MRGCGMCCVGHYSAAATHRQRRVPPWARCCGPVDRSPREEPMSVVGKQKVRHDLVSVVRGNGQVPAHSGCGGEHSPSPRRQGRICTESASAPPKPASYSPPFCPPKCGKARLQHKWLKGEKPELLSDARICSLSLRRAQKSI